MVCCNGGAERVHYRYRDVQSVVVILLVVFRVEDALKSLNILFGVLGVQKGFVQMLQLLVFVCSLTFVIFLIRIRTLGALRINY